LWTAQIGGAVHDASGRAVAGASVTIQTLLLGDSPKDVRGNCAGALNAPISTTSGQDGRYRVTVTGAARPIVACLFVEATSAAAGTSMHDLVERDSVVIGPPPVDSLEVNLVVRP